MYTIFRRYLEVGSIMALSQDLQRQGIRTRRQTLSNGKIRGDIPFGVGALHHLLKNRFLIGEVVHGGQVYRGNTSQSSTEPSSTRSRPSSRLNPSRGKTGSEDHPRS